VTPRKEPRCPTNLTKRRTSDLEFSSALGAYIGPVKRDEARKAISRYTTGQVIIDYPANGDAGGERRRAGGWMEEIGAGDGLFVFIPWSLGVPLGGRPAFVNSWVLDLRGDDWRAERYVDGLHLHFRGALLRLVFWHDAFHERESGGSAPGWPP
jgi:hypothetical protein